MLKWRVDCIESSASKSSAAKSPCEWEDMCVKKKQKKKLLLSMKQEIEATCLHCHYSCVEALRQKTKNITLKRYN